MENKKLKILIIDDEHIIRRLFVDFLKDEYDVYSAENGEEALQMVFEKKFDVVFCDIHMPGKSGVDVLKEMKLLHKDLPIVMMDSFPEITARKLGDLGAFAFIHKPFYLKEIRSILKEVAEMSAKGTSFKGADRRKSVRFPSLLDITYKIDDIEGHDPEKTLSKNVSITGMLIETSQPLKPDMILTISIKKPYPVEFEFEKHLKLKAKVKWCLEKKKDERYDTGIEFMKNQENEINELKKILKEYFL